jgi:hypothetical protein
VVEGPMSGRRRRKRRRKRRREQLELNHNQKRHRPLPQLSGSNPVLRCRTSTAVNSRTDQPLTFVAKFGDVGPKILKLSGGLMIWQPWSSQPPYLRANQMLLVLSRHREAQLVYTCPSEDGEYINLPFLCMQPYITNNSMHNLFTR